jgi:hypothetical protein
LAQADFRKGFVVTLEGDTISGLVNYREGANAHEICDFKGLANQNTTSYTPDEILGYGFLADKLFESRKIQETGKLPRVAFVEVLVKGIVSLYKANDSFFMDKNGGELHHLANDAEEIEFDGRPVLKQTNRHIGIMNMLFHDCVEMRPKRKISLTERALSAEVEAYNECRKTSSVIYKANKPWVKWHLGIAGGMKISKINFDEEVVSQHLEGSFETSNSPIIGISIDVLSPRISERFSFHSDILYTGTKYYNFNSVSTSFSSRRDYVAIELRELKVPMAFRYTGPGKIIRPFLNAGVSATFHLESNSSWIREIESNHVVQSFSREALPISKDQFGFWGGIGILKSINKKYEAFLELRYEQTNGIGDNSKHVTYVVVSKVDNIHFTIGIRTN